jgi:hypothetical protein
MEGHEAAKCPMRFGYTIYVTPTAYLKSIAQQLEQINSVLIPLTLAQQQLQLAFTELAPKRVTKPAPEPVPTPTPTPTPTPAQKPKERKARPPLTEEQRAAYNARRRERYREKKMEKTLSVLRE